MTGAAALTAAFSSVCDVYAAQVDQTHLERSGSKRFVWVWQLRSRSQRTRWSWDKFWSNLLPEVEIQHLYAEVRLALAQAQYGSNTRGKNRVLQERQHGSVRGALGNRHPYRDSLQCSS